MGTRARGYRILFNECKKKSSFGSVTKICSVDITLYDMARVFDCKLCENRFSEVLFPAFTQNHSICIPQSHLKGLSFLMTQCVT